MLFRSVFTPKSMLRLKEATSPAADFASGSFCPVIGDRGDLDPAGVRRVLLCSGKVYYDLAHQRDEDGRTDTAIVRVERLYPLPAEELAATIASYPAADEVTWVQEEPANMGAWPTMALKLPEALGRPVSRVSLPASSAPAAGSATAHAVEHRKVVGEAVLQA